MAGGLPGIQRTVTFQRNLPSRVGFGPTVHMLNFPNACMDEGIARNTSRYFPKPIESRKQPLAKTDYKAKLWKSPGSLVDSDDLPSCGHAECIRELVLSFPDGVAFQSVAVATLQTLRRVLDRQYHAARAAISLAQGEKLERMIWDSEATVDAIAGILNSQGLRMLNLAREEPDRVAAGNSWWFALAEVIESIDDGIKCIMSLASGQPKGGPARQLSSAVLRLLREQHRQLLAEADAWIS